MLLTRPMYRSLLTFLQGQKGRVQHQTNHISVSFEIYRSLLTFVRAQKGGVQHQSNQERGTAYSYVAQIKKRFEYDPQIYREFLRILQLYKDSVLDIATVKAKVSTNLNH